MIAEGANPCYRQLGGRNANALRELPKLSSNLGIVIEILFPVGSTQLSVLVHSMSTTDLGFETAENVPSVSLRYIVQLGDGTRQETLSNRPIGWLV